MKLYQAINNVHLQQVWAQLAAEFAKDDSVRVHRWLTHNVQNHLDAQLPHMHEPRIRAPHVDIGIKWSLLLTPRDKVLLPQNNMSRVKVLDMYSLPTDLAEVYNKGGMLYSWHLAPGELDEMRQRLSHLVEALQAVHGRKKNWDQLAAVMLQSGTPEQVKEAVVYAARPSIIEEMRAAAAAVDSEEEEDGEDVGQDDEDTPPSGPPVVDDAANFFHARLKQLEGYRLDDQLVIAVGFWVKPVAESELLEFMVRHGFGKAGTIKLRLAHVVNVRQELTRTEKSDGFYYSVGPKSVNLKPRPKTAPYKPKTQPQETTRQVSELVQPTVSVVSKPTEHPLVEPVVADKAIELTENSKVTYLVDSNGGMTINVSGINVLCFNPGAAAKLVNFTSNVKGLYDL